MRLEERLAYIPDPLEMWNSSDWAGLHYMSPGFGIMLLMFSVVFGLLTIGTQKWNATMITGILLCIEVINRIWGMLP